MIVKERITIESDDRRLEGMLAYPETGLPSFGVLLTGPHPFLGGDLGNNVVRALLESVPRSGGLALSFNYAGVGRSEGGPGDWPAAMSEFWQRGRIDYEDAWVTDAAYAWSTLSGLTAAPRMAVGYSFGCWCLPRAAANGEAGCVVLISPNVRKHDLSFLDNSPASQLVLCSDNDFTCEPSEVQQWFGRLAEPKTLTVVNASEHFFRGQEREVAECVLDFLPGAGVDRVNREAFT